MYRVEEEKKRFYWRKLDNSAKIFPLSGSKRYNAIFRVSCMLKEKVNANTLRHAVERALKKYEFFRVRMKQGFFWYYLEYNPKTIVIEKEINYPCQNFDLRSNHDFLFKVTYFENKINIDICHVLTDGNSGTNFFKEIVYQYIELAHPKEFSKELRTSRKIEYSTEDSYIKNYNKKAKSNVSNQKAYILKGNKIALEAIGVVHAIINLNDLKRICQEKEVTITQYLTAVLLYAIYEENYKPYRGKKPIKVCIPVNLKKYFPSETLSNFFSYITLEAQMEKEHLTTFDAILSFVKKDFEKKLEKEEIIKTMSANVKLGNNPFIRGIPLVIKKILVRAAYVEIRKYTTITFSNIGRIGIIGAYKDYIDNFLLLISPEPVEKIKCSACTFEDKLVFTFTTILEDASIEKNFISFLQKQGIKVEEETNQVLE